MWMLENALHRQVVWRESFLQLHSDLNLLAALCIADRFGRDILDLGEFANDGLHLPRGDVLSRSPDHILRPPYEPIKAKFVAAHQIARFEPAQAYLQGLGALRVSALNFFVRRTARWATGKYKASRPVRSLARAV